MNNDTSNNGVVQMKLWNLPTPAQPFLKWAGGKQRLISQFEPHFPREFRRYVEPFVGGGAVFFHLSNTHSGMPAFLSDVNEELVNCYQVVRSQLGTLVELLAEHEHMHSEEYYYAVRGRFLSEELTPVERAARLMYLNKTCYNGLYRVNSKGQFNVPIGRYESPAILRRDTLRAASQALQGVEIEVRDFRECLDVSQAGDFVYFDPPYHPISETSDFTGYTKDGFGADEQRALADVFGALDRVGCKVMLSNSWTRFVLELYDDYKIVEVRAARAINSRADRRGKVREVLVLNY